MTERRSAKLIAKFVDDYAIRYQPKRYIREVIFGKHRATQFWKLQLIPNLQGCPSWH
jgi:hypothetical protein